MPPSIASVAPESLGLGSGASLAKLQGSNAPHEMAAAVGVKMEGYGVSMADLLLETMFPS